jgi:phage tail-like protein
VAAVAYAQTDPFLIGSFWIEVQGVILASFAECSGLSAETEVQEYSEGGRNDVVYKLPVRTRYSNITLRRGWTNSTELWSWYQEVIDGTVRPRDCSIVMCSNDGQNPGDELARVNVSQAFPVKWQGPDLKADSAGAAVETLELAHLGFRRG